VHLDPQGSAPARALGNLGFPTGGAKGETETARGRRVVAGPGSRHPAYAALLWLSATLLHSESVQR
jgi:hypothetical protein